MRFEPPSIKERGQVARAMAAVQAQKPAQGEAKGNLACTRCGGALKFTIQSNGLSSGQCSCGVRWCQ